MTKLTKSSKEVQVQEPAFTQSQIDLIKNTVARGATDDELKLFLYTAARTGLDPLTRQIFFVKRWDSKLGRESGAIQTGIDGYRAIADRTGQLAGIDDPVYEENVMANGEKAGSPFKATVSVYKIVSGVRVAFTASARWSEYAPVKAEKAFMWSKMPYLMLGKVAEALALRKAFPLNLSGLYTTEEMAQAQPTINAMNMRPGADLGLEQGNESMEEVIDITPIPEKPTVSDKTKIAHLVKLLNIQEPLEETIKGITGCEWLPENYEEIVAGLEEVYKESREK